LAAHSTLKRFESEALSENAHSRKIIPKMKAIEAFLIKESLQAIPCKSRGEYSRAKATWADANLLVF